jgi:hypothetical protein
MIIFVFHMVMEINLKIPARDVEHFKMFYKQKLQDLLVEVDEVRETLKQLDAMSWMPSNPQNYIDTLRISLQSSKKTVSGSKDANPLPVLIPLGYKKSWSNIKKAEFLLNRASQPMTTTEIVNTVMRFEPELRDRPKVVRNFSSILGSHSKPGGLLSRTKNDDGEWVYALAASGSADQPGEGAAVLEGQRI